MITISENRPLNKYQVLDLYAQNRWSSAQKPEELMNALTHSHSLVSAWDRDLLVGLANAISDGYLVVYYPHLLVLPDYQIQGVGKMIMERMQEKYKGFHQQILVADHKAVGFYEKCNFEKANRCEPMWVYKGNDHQ